MKTNLIPTTSVVGFHLLQIYYKILLDIDKLFESFILSYNYKLKRLRFIFNYYQ